ncbi:hypothetical protein V8C37DRAFT_378819 [Trichoderma ceciliae]
MALVIGLVAAAARAVSSNTHDRQNYNGSSPGYNGQHHNGNTNHNNDYGSSINYNTSPYAAYPPKMSGARRAGRRMNRTMRKAERKARETGGMVMALTGSGARSNPCSAPPLQAVSGGVPYMRYEYGDNPRARDMYPLESQGLMVGSHASHKPSGPEGYQWQAQDAQSFDRPASREDRHAGGSSTESLPTYEQVVRRSGKS